LLQGELLTTQAMVWPAPNWESVTARIQWAEQTPKGPASQIQKVSAQLELSKTAPKTVSNDQ
jgi:hypothetical protein